MTGALAPIVLLSIEVSTLALLVSGLIGIPIGAWLGLASFRGRSIVRAAVNAGMGLPPVLVGLVVYLLLSRSGPLASLDWLFTPSAMILAQVILCLPLVIGITAAAVAAISPELRLQLRSLGASPWQIRAAIVREARPGILLALTAAFGRSTSEVGAVLMVGGNIEGHTRVLTTAVVLETGQGHFATALALGAWLLVLTLTANVVIVRLQARTPA
jgi:tungstate transport system permease protein